MEGQHVLPKKKTKLSEEVKREGGTPQKHISKHYPNGCTFVLQNFTMKFMKSIIMQKLL